MLSVIIPSYNEATLIGAAVETVSRILKEAAIDYEMIFIDDGSTDGTYKQILKATSEDTAIRGLSFSRNFGKEAAIFAGLEAARGDCCVVMDCDLQHPPDVIPQMYKLWLEGYQIVEGIKTWRGTESMLYRLATSTFYRLMSRFAGLNLKGSSDYKLLDRKVIDSILSLSEKHRFFRGLSFWLGYKSTSVEYRVADRVCGESKWSVFKLTKYGINNISNFTSMPLYIVSLLGCLMLASSFIAGIQTVILYFTGKAAEGFSTVILLILLTGGSIMVSLGIIGHYIAKIYDEVKNRPMYIIDKCTDGKI